MSIEILMPALSPTMEEGTLAKWNIKEGDTVESGDVIAEIETDKATMEVEAVEEGTVAKLLVEEGTENVKVNAVIAILAEEGEDVAAAAAPSAPVAEAAPVESAPAIDERPAMMQANVASLADPDIPAGTSFTSTTVRDALRDAMAEEMRRDDTVFVMGEEVAEYQGAYKVTRELLQEFGPKRDRKSVV